MVGENQSSSGVRTPRFYSPLKCPDLSIGELSGILAVKAFHEFRGISTGFDIKPRPDSWPDSIEWIGARPPVACGPRLRTMGRPDLTFLPSGGETFEELLQVRVPPGRGTNSQPVGNRGQVMLHCANFV